MSLIPQVATDSSSSVRLSLCWNQVLENAERNNPGPLTDAAVRRLFERIIDEARAAERDAMHSGDGSATGGQE